MPLETRIYSAAKELRVTSAAGVRKLEGYAAVFDKESELIWGMFREVIMPGAFAAALSREDLDVRALHNHDANLLLGRSKSGTLRLKEDDTGLWCSIDLPKGNLGEQIGESVARGDLTQMSFAFTLAEGGDRWVWEKGAEDPKRIIGPNGVEELRDVCTATYPAYPDTEINAKRAFIDAMVEARSLDQKSPEQREALVKKFEALVRGETPPPSAPNTPPVANSDDELYTAQVRQRQRTRRYGS